jgi:hypothetical protein
MSLVEINWRPDRHQLRRFALAWGGVFALIGAVAAWDRGPIAGDGGSLEGGRWLWPSLIWTAAVIGSVGGLLAPPFASWLYRISMALALPLGWLVSHALLALLYYVVFTGFALLFRALNRDVLHRRFDLKQRSYWVERDPVSGIDRYFRQF